jgi:Domain of unknown function (DUF4386)
MVTVNEMEQPATSIQRLARVTGGLYLALGVIAMFSALVVESVGAPEDVERPVFGVSLVTWLGVVLADAVLAVTFYLILRPVDRTLSLVAAALRLTFAGMLGAILIKLYDAHTLLTGTDRMAAMDSFGTGFLAALVIFGVYVMMLGYLFYRSRYVPRLLSAVVLAAGACYIVDSLASVFVAGYGGVVNAVLIVIMTVGEVGLAGWLLVKGVDAGGR